MFIDVKQLVTKAKVMEALVVLTLPMLNFG